MRNPHGYMSWIGPEGPPIERDTAQCAHCNKHFSSVGGWCSCCAGPICTNQRCNNGCTPFEKKLDLYERSNRFAEAAGLVLN